jgi:signal peptidase
MKKVLNAISTILCVCLTVILVINSTLIIQSFIDEDKIPDVFGYFPLVVMTDSMYPLIEGGDLAIYQKQSADQVTVGDVIVFYDEADSSHNTLVTHRIVDEDEGTGYKTKGDANNTEDNGVVAYEDVVGILKTSIPNIGNAVLFMQTTKGMLVCIVLPLCLLFIIESFIHRKGEKEAVKGSV